MMYALYQPTLLLLLAAISLVAASALPETLEPRTCSKLILPTNFYGITTAAPNATLEYGPYPPPTDPFFNFQVSQASDGAQGLSEESDLIATYTGLPCKPYRSFTLEFFFDPVSDYGYSGNNTRVDIWRVDGDIPRDQNGKGTPTWNNMGHGLIFVGRFKMPASEAEQVRKVFRVGGFACKKEVSFRVSIANDFPLPPESGWVSYPQEYAGATDTGLRIRYSC